MTFAFVVLWMAMGQQPQPPNFYLAPQLTMSHRPSLSSDSKVAAPVEHVFEIKTKTNMKHALPAFPGNKCPIGTVEIAISNAPLAPGFVAKQVLDTLVCLRVTRELWIDGKYAGIVKGLD